MHVLARSPNKKPIMIPVSPEFNMSLKNDAKNPTPKITAIIKAIG